MNRLLRVFFYLLYHPFAWAYDLVAATVSLGWWQDWVMSVLSFVEGRRVLELGHGPGHLQVALRKRGLFAVGLDESPHMGALARSRLRRGGWFPLNLTRALAQALPFAPQTFDAVVATFPTDFFLDACTLAEVRRVLRHNGLFVVLPVAWPNGPSPLWCLAGFLFRVTGQAPEDPMRFIRPPFVRAGFDVRSRRLDLGGGRLLVVLARPASRGHSGIIERMDTKTRLENALKEALRSGDEVRKRTVRMVRAAIKQAEVDRQTVLDEAAVISILQKEVKKRREALEEAKRAHRDDLVQEAEAEIAVLEEFLPEAMSEGELRALAEAVIAEVGAESPADMGKVMKVLMPRVAGRAPGGQVSQVVRALLQK